jgi:hypothetical protein
MTITEFYTLAVEISMRTSFNVYNKVRKQLHIWLIIGTFDIFIVIAIMGSLLRVLV